MFHKMHILFSSLAVIISLLNKNGHCTSQDPEILIDKVSGIYFDIEELQKSLKDNNPSVENLLKIVEEIGSTLILMLSKLESSKSFESAFISKMQNLDSDVEELRKDLNKTEYENQNLSTRIIDIESSKTSESAFTTKMQNLNSEMEELRENVNETECSLSTRIIDIENDISKLRNLLIKVENESARKEKKRKIPRESDFAFTPYLPYERAKSRCNRGGGTVFVPKTKDDFRYLVEGITENDYYAYLPLTLKNGVLVWDDGTNYEDGPFRLETPITNIDIGDCIVVNHSGVGYGTECTSYNKMLCVFN